MTLDSWLVARLARELDVMLRGARIQSVQTLRHGVIFLCYRRGVHIALHARLDSSDPMVGAYECARPEKESGPTGWLGDVAPLLRGASIEAVSVVPHDRVMIFDVSSRSAFGVPSRSRLVFEIQPRKANALVLRAGHDAKSWVIVAAEKQFAQSGVRRVAVGSSYEPPPARRSTLDRAQFIVAARELSNADAKGWERLLAAHDPRCTPTLAKEVVHRFTTQGEPQRAHAALLGWTAVCQEVEAALERMGSVYFWSEGETVALCHLIQLSWPSWQMGTIESLNDLSARALREQPASVAGSPRVTIKKRLQTMLARCEQEVQSLERSLDVAQQADRWRAAGETIYANLSDIPPNSREFIAPDGARTALDPLLTPKQNAAEYFRKYKKARSSVAPVRARLQTLQNNREYWEHLLWEAERDDLDAAQRGLLMAELAAAIGMKRQEKKTKRTAAPHPRVELSDGAVAYVGRSPKENERLTFSVAGPNDYWFHARGLPGAHVIVKTNGIPLVQKQIQEAAALAAAHSRGAGAKSVDVDYTRRKHVRRRGGGRAGLVWYTDFATIRVNP